MPHFYNLSTNHRDVLPEDQKNFPAAEVHAVSHYLLTESTNHLSGRDFNRLALLDGKQNLQSLQKALIAGGLDDRAQKELFDVSRRFTDLALLSAPLQAEAINQEGIRQRQVQEQLSELHRRRKDLEARGVAGPEADAVKKEIAASGQELTRLTTRLIDLARPSPLADRLINEDGQPVALPAKDGDPVNGRRLFTERGCLACHGHQAVATPLKQGDKTLVHAVACDAEFGPELSRIADKLAPTLDKVSARRWLVQWMLNPTVYHPRTRMPVTFLSLSDANDVATWLLSQKTGWQGKPPEPQAPTLQDYVKLARVYLAKAPGVTRTDLDAYLPADGKPAGIPADRLAAFPRDAEERKLVQGQVDEAALKWYVGRKAIGRLGCYACHDIPGFETAKPIGVGLNDWGRKDNERIAFEDGAAFAREHFNLISVRKTRPEVEARVKAIEAKEEKDRTGAEKKELKTLQDQIAAQPRIAELERQQQSKGLRGAEARELEELRPLKFFAPSEDGKRPPMEEFFFHALEHHQREGFLQLKLAEPRSYDYNRLRPWDDRLRMPQFRFARTRKTADESDEAYQARQHKEEAEAREAVMTFVLGLVATPMPLKYLHRPNQDKMAEIVGRQVLEKYNCGGCHQIRPGVFDFKLTEETTQALFKSYQSAMTPQKQAEDYPFLNHSAWFGNGGHGDWMHALGYFNELQTSGRREAGEQVDVVYLSEAIRFVGPDRVVRNLPAGTNLVLPEGSYRATRPFGGTWTDLMLPYLSRKNSTDFPATKPENARSVLPPPLHREGERIQPDWGYRFLLNPGMVRPQETMLLRMPRFNLSKEEAQAAINYFAAVSRMTNPGAGVQYPYVQIEQRDGEFWQRMNAQYEGQARAAMQKRQEERKKADEERKKAEDERRKIEGDLAALKKEMADPKNAKKADELKKGVADKEAALKAVADRIAKLPAPVAADADGGPAGLYARHAFNLLADKNLCLKCHNIGGLRTDKPQAPNLGMAAERLRPDWVERWIAVPERMFTYFPVMPQNFKNVHDPLQWENQDKFVGPPLQQIRAVRDLLMDSPRLNSLIATTTPTPPAAAGGTKK
ncbi:MAG: c-type cytochrome [Gemmataceae bacterium]